MQVRKFDMKLIHTVLMGMIPLILIDDELISLAALEYARAHDDGTLELNLMSGRNITLTATQAATIAANLKAGIETAQQAAAREAARQMGILTH